MRTLEAPSGTEVMTNRITLKPANLCSVAFVAFAHNQIDEIASALCAQQLVLAHACNAQNIYTRFVFSSPVRSKCTVALNGASTMRAHRLYQMQENSPSPLQLNHTNVHSCARALPKKSPFAKRLCGMDSLLLRCATVQMLCEIKTGTPPNHPNATATAQQGQENRQASTYSHTHVMRVISPDLWLHCVACMWARR